MAAAPGPVDAGWGSTPEESPAELQQDGRLLSQIFNSVYIYVPLC